MKDYEINAPSFEDISVSSGVILLEFGAPWCGHCQAAQDSIQEAMANHPEVKHIKVFDGKGKKLGRQFKVKLWPSLILLRDGKEVARKVRPTQTAQINLLLTK